MKGRWHISRETALDQERPDAGFTLIETMVVLLIFAIVMGVGATTIVVRDRTPSPYDIAKRIQSIAFKARSDAIFENRRTAIVLDTKQGLIRYRREPILQLPENQTMSVLAGQELTLSEGRVALAFLPDGSSSGAEITLADDRERNALLKVFWLTGLPRISMEQGS